MATEPNYDLEAQRIHNLLSEAYEALCGMPDSAPEQREAQLRCALMANDLLRMVCRWRFPDSQSVPSATTAD